MGGYSGVTGPETRLQEADKLKADEAVGRARVDHIVKPAPRRRRAEKGGIGCRRKRGWVCVSRMGVPKACFCMWTGVTQQREQDA